MENYINILGDDSELTINDIPEIDLYMDQVLTLINNKFDGTKYGDGKQLTKTMINNYAKAKIIPSPEKKKYSKDHIIMLILINFHKSIMSIVDISTLLNPLSTNHFHNKEVPLAEIAEKLLSPLRNIKSDDNMLSLYKKCSNLFDSSYADAEYLNTLAFVHMLSYQSHLRQKMIAHIMDDLKTEFEKNASEKDAKQ